MPNLWSLRSTHECKVCLGSKGWLCLHVWCVRWELCAQLCNMLPLDTEGSLLLMLNYIYKPLQRAKSFQKHKKAPWIFCKHKGWQRFHRLSNSTAKGTKTLLRQIEKRVFFSDPSTLHNEAILLFKSFHCIPFTVESVPLLHCCTAMSTCFQFLCFSQSPSSHLALSSPFYSPFCAFFSCWLPIKRFLLSLMDENIRLYLLMSLFKTLISCAI